MNLKKFLATALLIIAPCFNARGSCSSCPDQEHKLRFAASAYVAGSDTQDTLQVKMSMRGIQKVSPVVPASNLTVIWATTEEGKIKILTEETYTATVTLDTTSTISGCGNYLKAHFEADICGTIESRFRILTLSGSTWSEWQKSSSCNTYVDCFPFSGNVQHAEVEIEVKLIKKANNPNGGGGGDSGDSSSTPPELPDSAQSSPPDANGDPSQTTPPGFHFQVPMGATPTSSGFNTGSLSLSGPLSQSLVDVTKLELRNAFGEGMQVVTSEGSLRQVTDLERLADINPISGGGVEIRFFNKDSFGTELAEGLYPLNQGAQPYLTVSLTPVVPSGTDHLGGIRVSTTGADGVTTWKEVLSTSADGNAWREVLDNGAEIRNYASLFDYNSTTSQWRRIDLNEVSKNGVLISKNQRTYLYQVKRDSQTSAVLDSARFLAEEVVYDTANSTLTTTWEPDPTQLGRAKSVTRPDGSWESYRYYDDVGEGEDSAWRGMLKETLRPWNGQPVNPSQATGDNSESTVVTYQASSSGALPAREVTTRPSSGGTVTVSDSITTVYNTHPYGALLEEAGLNPAWVPRQEDVFGEGHSEKASANESLNSDYSYVYVGAHVTSSDGSGEAVDAPWVGRSMARVDGEGNGSITGYERGTFSASNQMFTVNAPPISPYWGKDVRSISLKLENNQLPGNLRATKEVAIEDEDGKTLRKEVWIKDANGGWALATVTTYEYPALWADGSPKEILVKQDGRVISRTLEVSNQETVVWDEQGIETRTLRDTLGRTVSVTRVGNGSQPDQVTTYGYSDLGTLVTTTAGDVSRTQITVSDLAGRTISETAPSGAVTTTAYSDGGRETLTTQPGGLTQHITRSIDGRTVSITGTAGVDEFYGYEVLSNGNLVTTQRIGDLDNSPRYTSTEEDWAGRTVKVTTPSPTGSGEVVTESFYQSGTKVIDHTISPTGIVVFSEDLSQGIKYSGLDANHDLHLTASSTDRMTADWGNYALENGFWWEVSISRTYDTNGSDSSYVESISKRCLHGNPNGLAAWNLITLPTGGSIETQTMIDRATKTLVQTEISSAASNPAISTNVNGLLVSQQGHDATQPTVWEYDGFGQPIREISPREAITRKSYFADGKLETSTDHAGKVTQYAYYPATHVSAGKLATVTNPDGKTTTYAYSNLGQVTEEAGTAAYKVTYAYDAYGAKNKMWTWRDATHSDLTEWVYQAGTGLLTAKKDAAGKGATYTYNAAGKIATLTWARGVSATYSYSALGDLSGIDYSDTTPDVTLTDYDRLGRPGTITQAGIGTESLTYHAGKATPNARFYTIGHGLLPGIGLRTLAPDAAGRPTGFAETANSNATVLRMVGYTYNATTGLLETITDGTQNHTYAYHSNSSLISTIHSNSGSTAWFRESRYYDTPGRLIGIRSDRMNGTTVAAAISAHAYDYDSLGRRTKNTFQDGSFWQYGYNDRSEVTSATRKTANGVEVAPLGATYAYDGIGNRLSSASAVLGTHTYTPNSLNQYATITAGNSRTAVGRAPTDWTVQVAGVNASRVGEIFYRPLTAANTTAPVWQDVVIQRDSGTPTMTRHFWYASQTFAPVYDDDGNLTNDGRWLYTWNAENRLIQMETTSQATAAGHPYTKLQFGYDWEGHRIARHVWQGGSQASPVFKSSHRWLYDGWNVVAEFFAPSATSTELTRVNTFTWGLDLGDSDGIPRQRSGGVGGLLVQTSVSSGVIERASYDGIGNIVAWTKSTATAPTSRSEYDAFGNTVVSEGTIPSAFGFSTKLQDAEIGLYYYGYRSYNPATGSWISRDPSEEKGGVNLYGFIGNDSLDFYDRLGLWKDVAHYEIIDEWLKKAEKEEDRKYAPYNWHCIEVPVGELLKKGNDEIDGTGHEGKWALVKAQTSEKSYMHAMRAPGQDAATARALMENFIREEKLRADNLVNRARQLIDSDNPVERRLAGTYIKDAVRHIGRLQHPIADSTSPSHAGFQLWPGPEFILLSPARVIDDWYKHSERENEDVFKSMKSSVVETVKQSSHPYLHDVLAE